jgi:hypothetical protein
MVLPTGVFPKVLLVVGSLAVYNAIQCFVPSMRLTPRIYALKTDEGKDEFWCHCEGYHKLGHRWLIGKLDDINEPFLFIMLHRDPYFKKCLILSV